MVEEGEIGGKKGITSSPHPSVRNKRGSKEVKTTGGVSFHFAATAAVLFVRSTS